MNRGVPGGHSASKTPNVRGDSWVTVGIGDVGVPAVADSTSFHGMRSWQSESSMSIEGSWVAMDDVSVTNMTVLGRCERSAATSRLVHVANAGDPVNQQISSRSCAKPALVAGIPVPPRSAG